MPLLSSGHYLILKLTVLCRPMVLAEKKQLQKMIKGLPRENLDRVAELIERNKPADERSDDEIHVDLEKEVKERANGYELLSLL